MCVHTSEGKRHDYRLLKDSRVRLKKDTKAVFDWVRPEQNVIAAVEAAW